MFLDTVLSNVWGKRMFLEIRVCINLLECIDFDWTHVFSSYSTSRDKFVFCCEDYELLNNIAFLVDDVR